MKQTKTKAMKENYNYYLRNENGNSLYYVYNTYSCEKGRAFKYCQELMAKYNGYNGKVLHGNTFTFTFGFVGEIEGKKAYFHITRDNDKYILLD